MREGCNEVIARLREFLANCKTDVAAGDLLDMASEAGADDVDWQVLKETLAGVKDNVDFNRKDQELLCGFLMRLMSKWHEEAR